jgi:taurine dioxygenase
MQTHVLEPLGALVTDLQVGELDPIEARRVAELLAHNGVLILPGQDADDRRFLAFLSSLGPLTFTKGETPVADFPDLNVVSNVGRATPPRSSWHVDTSYVREPPAYTALRVVEVPAQGGETLFSDQYAAYETLDGHLRDELAGRSITHVASGVDLGDGDEHEAAHPVFRRHPISASTALYLTTPARCRAISGLSEERSRELIEHLYVHSTREENVLRHAWAPGDVVIWDNGCVLHRADHSGVAGDRVLHRGLVARYPTL